MGFLKFFLHSKVSQKGFLAFKTNRISACCVNRWDLTYTKVKYSYLIALKEHTNNCVSNFFGQSEDTSKIDEWYLF